MLWNFDLRTFALLRGVLEYLVSLLRVSYDLELDDIANMVVFTNTTTACPIPLFFKVLIHIRC